MALRARVVAHADLHRMKDYTAPGLVRRPSLTLP